VRMFAGAVRLDGGMPPLSFRAAVRGAPYCKDHQLRWVTADGLIAVVGPESGACPPAIVRRGSVTVVGVARVDNRAELLKLIRCADPAISDLELVGELALARRSAGVARILGDFAFVVWEADTRTLIAARDTFGVKQLYYASPSPGVVTFSSRAELLAQGDDYNIEYLAAWVSYCPPDPSSAVYPRVSALPPASVLRFDQGLPRVVSYWNAHEAQGLGVAPQSETEQIDAVRQLLIEAVRNCVTDGPSTWAHLSGGMDSSSVVSTAQWLASTGITQHGLAGTLSFVDPIGSAADEREYSDAVVARYGIRNELIPHQVDHTGILSDPPRFDQPAVCSYGVATRDLAAAATIKGAGGSVLLTGAGGDNLFLGTMFFFADWLAAGQITRAMREMARRSAIGRVSFWNLAYENAIVPLLPGGARRKLPWRSQVTVPSWVMPEMVRRYSLDKRVAIDSVYGGSRGSKYAFGQVAAVSAIPSIIGAGVLDDETDVRHPYLFRPLVELALRLPPESCVRPHQRKWVLREAMRGILPEAVRTRVGKGNGGGFSAWGLQHEASLVSQLTRDSVLAELGIVSEAKLRRAITTFGQDDSDVGAWAQGTLNVELWLRVRSGRWGSEIAVAQPNRNDQVSVFAGHSVNAIPDEQSRSFR
jgi:asparagine synthase (glutamine-hydrolysing)